MKKITIDVQGWCTVKKYMPLVVECFLFCFGLELSAIKLHFWTKVKNLIFLVVCQMTVVCVYIFFAIEGLCPVPGHLGKRLGMGSGNNKL